MSVRAFVNADKPIIRISTNGAPPCAEIEFETIEDANAAVEQLNAILKNASGLTFKMVGY
jgi:hypothetical protein